MRSRREIIATMWEAEEQSCHFKNFKKHSPLWEENQKIIEATKDDFWEKAKEAVIGKYLTFCKNIYIDTVMLWRLKFLSCRFPSRLKGILQFRMLIVKSLVSK